MTARRAGRRRRKRRESPAILWIRIFLYPVTAAMLTGVLLRGIGASTPTMLIAVAVGCIVGTAAVFAGLWWTLQILDRTLFQNGVMYVGPALLAAAATFATAAVIGWGAG